MKFDRFVVLAAYNLIHRCYHESPPKMIRKALLGVGFAGGSVLLGGNCRRWISTNCAFFCIFIWWVRKKFVILHPKTKRKGRLAEGLGTGLQNLLLRFKSGSDLSKKGLHSGDLFSFAPCSFHGTDAFINVNGHQLFVNFFC